MPAGAKGRHHQRGHRPRRRRAAGQPHHRSTGVAAVAGVPAFHAVSARPRWSRNSRTRALASRTRDYSFIVLNDMFYGPVPPYVEKPLVPFTLGRLDDVTMKRNDKPYPVKIPLSGDGMTARRSSGHRPAGSLIAEDSLEIDPKTNSIILPAITRNRRI